LQAGGVRACTYAQHAASHALILRWRVWRVVDSFHLLQYCANARAPRNVIAGAGAGGMGVGGGRSASQQAVYLYEKAFALSELAIIDYSATKEKV
jgi:hypothetical protein